MLAGAIIGAHFFFKNHQNIIFSGVMIEGHDFSRLTKKEARGRLKEITAPLLNKSIVLEGKNDSWLLDLSEIRLDFKEDKVINKAIQIGRRGNILQRGIEVWETAKYGKYLELELSYDEKALREILLEISQEINISPRNAHLDLKTKEIVEAQKGRSLNREESRRKIINRISDLERLPIKLIIDDQNFRVSKEELKKWNLTNGLSSYATKFNLSKENRTYNIKLASNRINGTLLKPGEVFSFNEIVGPRTLKAGFKEAIEIVNQEFVEGIGGGVCQLSSTLYNAALLGDFEILARQNHSRPVSYVPLGRGATVYYDYLDFKFKNNASFPIMILSKAIENKLLVMIMGESKDYEVQIITEEPKVIDYEREEKVDESLSNDQRILVRQGKEGYRIVVKKRIFKDGKTIREELVSEDIYQPVDEVIKVSDK
jgi:vancomycin resistance protein VanW